ncbi:hypothetical protein SmJEL517_g02043 [Synchytrium microbalum]|uniref:Uncharacterized protein n=1 Tax=Synchytrium microbalum TaxID=1806994 RepID=A0A507C218_9FUNG|nr:uncharacterized protein SmJEL517_g02043 [Synchytrium microbalum]TPX35560.1 hypothetical protein SmJEL517_g02043 [Synchytrium microbalum]
MAATAIAQSPSNDIARDVDSISNSSTDSQHQLTTPGGSVRGRISTQNDLHTARDRSKDWNAAMNRRKNARARISQAGGIGAFIPNFNNSSQLSIDAIATADGPTDADGVRAVDDTQPADTTNGNDNVDTASLPRPPVRRMKSNASHRHSQIGLIASAWDKDLAGMVMAEASKQKDDDQERQQRPTSMAGSIEGTSSRERSKSRDRTILTEKERRRSSMTLPLGTKQVQPLQGGEQEDDATKSKRASRLHRRSRSLKRQSTLDLQDRASQLAHVAAGFDDGLREISLEGVYTREGLDDDASKKMVDRSRDLNEKHRSRSSMDLKGSFLNGKPSVATFATIITSLVTSVTAAVTGPSTPTSPTLTARDLEDFEDEKMPSTPERSRPMSLPAVPITPIPNQLPTTFNERKTDSAIDMPAPLVNISAAPIPPQKSNFVKPALPARKTSQSNLKQSTTASATINPLPSLPVTPIIASTTKEEPINQPLIIPNTASETPTPPRKDNQVPTTSNSTTPDQQPGVPEWTPISRPILKRVASQASQITMDDIPSLHNSTLPRGKLRPTPLSTITTAEPAADAADLTRKPSTESRRSIDFTSAFGVSLRKARKSRDEARAAPGQGDINDIDKASVASGQSRRLSIGGLFGGIGNSPSQPTSSSRPKPGKELPINPMTPTAPSSTISSLASASYGFLNSINSRAKATPNENSSLPPQRATHVPATISSTPSINSSISSIASIPQPSSPPPRQTAVPGKLSSIGGWSTSGTLSSPESPLADERALPGKNLPDAPKPSVLSPSAPRKSLDQLAGFGGLFSMFDRKPEAPAPIVRGAPPRRSNRAQEYAFDVAQISSSTDQNVIPTPPASNGTSPPISPAGSVRGSGLVGRNARIIPMPLGYTEQALKENAKTLAMPTLALQYLRHLVSLVNADADESGMIFTDALDIASRLSETQSGEAQYLLGTLYAKMGNFPKAVDNYGSAVRNKYPLAAWELGCCLETGEGMKKSDPARASRMYKTAAAAGHKQAEARLGRALWRGELTLEQDEKEGVRLLKAAAEGGADGEAAALYDLSWVFQKGSKPAGVEKDENMALSYLSKAASLNYAAACDKMGFALVNGSLGLQKDTKEAIGWYEKAAAQGYNDSIVALAALRKL